jgi:F0F1-type ATP synthase membrane subunit c/vacuolar-type H+-ATPase subunit K
MAGRCSMVPRSSDVHSDATELVRLRNHAVSKAFTALGACLLAVGALVAGIAAAIHGADGWKILSHNPAFRVGIALFAVGVVVTFIGLLPTGKPDIPPGHRNTLGATLDGVESAVQGIRMPTYGDSEGITRQRDSFFAHFKSSKDLSTRLREYERDVTDIVDATVQLNDHLNQQAAELGIVVPDYDVTQIVGAVHSSTFARAQQDSLSAPFQLNWAGYDSTGWVMPAGFPNAWVVVVKRGNESLDGWRGRVKECTDRIELLAMAAQEWAETEKIAAKWKESLKLRTTLAPLVRHAKDRETFKVVRSCPICRDNRQ